MFKILFVAFIVLIVGGLIFASEVVSGNIKGKGLAFIGICTGIASFILILNPDAIREIASGFNTIEKLTFDAKFEDIRIDGHVSGTLKDLTL